jgi:hypothetical protein
MAIPAVDLSRGTLTMADRVANVHPEWWREAIYQIRPLGGNSMTEFMDRNKRSQSVDSIRLHYPHQTYNNQQSTVTAVTVAGSTYSSGQADGTRVVITSALTPQLQPNDTIVVKNETTGVYLSLDVVGLDTQNNKITADLLEADTGSDLVVGARTLYVCVGSRSEQELAGLPDDDYEEVEYWANWTQAMMGAASISLRELSEKERLSPKVWQRKMDQAMDKLQRKREMMRLFGIPKSKANGRTFSGGYYYHLKTYASENIIDFKTCNSKDLIKTAGGTWDQIGMDFLIRVSERLQTYADSEQMIALTANKAKTSINEAVKYQSGIIIDTNENVDWGIRTRNLNGLNQTWAIGDIPRLSTNPMFQRTMLVFAPSALTTATKTPLKYIKPKTTDEDGWVWVSGQKCGWYIDEGLMMDNPWACAWITGIGEDNTATTLV